MSNTSLTSLLETCWQHLGRGVVDRRHPARFPSLATIGPDGPELRSLVLRRADRASDTLELHTDSLSPKVAQIKADPRVSLLIWLPKPKLQLRFKAHATLTDGDPDLFARLPSEAQANYSGRIPGSSLDAPFVEPFQATAERFTQILCELKSIDILSLDHPHRRAIFVQDDTWTGTWVAP